MATVEKSVLVYFSASSLYRLVRDVRSYPEFLPWCGSSKLEELSPEQDRASVEIVFKGVRQRFTTLNYLTPDEEIHMTLIEGPFQSLDGRWRFTPLQDNACKVTFHLNYEFSSKMLQQLVGPVFHTIANSLVDSFIRRAEALATQEKG